MQRPFTSRFVSAALLLCLLLLGLLSTSCVAQPNPSPEAARRAAIPPSAPAAGAAEVTYEPGDINNPNVKLLNVNSWEKEVKKGMFLVEFFSPYCPHCKKFAPTWETLVSMQEHLEDTSGFYLRRVNCIEQGDLCEAQDIKFYPSLHLYVEGSKTEEYSGGRDYDALTSYITARAADYRKLRAEKKKMEEAVAKEGFAVEVKDEAKEKEPQAPIRRDAPAGVGFTRIRIAREIHTLRR